jgi:outer membrane protein TolC
MRIKELQKDQFKVEINQQILLAKSNIQTGQEQMEIADEGLKFSAEALSQSMERQKLGTAQPFELFQSQQFYLKAQLDYLKSVTEFNKAQFSLKYAKGNPF